MGWIAATLVALSVIVMQRLVGRVPNAGEVGQIPPLLCAMLTCAPDLTFCPPNFIAVHETMHPYRIYHPQGS